MEYKAGPFGVRLRYNPYTTQHFNISVSGTAPSRGNNTRRTEPQPTEKPLPSKIRIQLICSSNLLGAYITIRYSTERTQVLSTVYLRALFIAMYRALRLQPRILVSPRPVPWALTKQPPGSQICRSPFKPRLFNSALVLRSTDLPGSSSRFVLFPYIFIFHHHRCHHLCHCFCSN